MSGLPAIARRAVAASVAAASLFLSAAAPAAEDGRVVVEIQAFEFVTEGPALSPGDLVVWKNLDIVPHTATAADGSWDSGLIEAGGSWEMVVTAETVLAYYCRYHPTMAAALTLAEH